MTTKAKTDITPVNTLTEEQKSQALAAALQGLQNSLAIFKQLGVLTDDATVNMIPSGPVATGTDDGKVRMMPARDAHGHFIPGVKVAVPVTKPAVDKKPAPLKVKRPTAPNLVHDFITWFIKAPEEDLYSVQRGQWQCIASVQPPEGDQAGGSSAHLLIFHSELLNDNAKSHGSHIVAIRPVGGLVTLFNASNITYGTSRWRAQKEPQQVAENAGAVPVPFENVIRKDTGAGLDAAKMQVLDWTGSEEMVIPPVHHNYGSTFYVVNRHFAGAVLLKIEEKYFIFDADREELKHHNFNPFFTQINEVATTVAEGYETLKPKGVKQALKNDVEVIRQGEFFFVRVPDNEVTGPMGAKNEFDRLTIEQIVARADELGAAVINMANAERLDQLDDFVEKSEKRDVQESTDRYIKDAKKILATEREYLATPVGPPIAWTPEKDKDGNRPGGRNSFGNSHAGEGHQYTHVDPIREELGVRLHEEYGSDRRFSIKFAQVLDATGNDASGNTPVRRGNGHIVTLSVTRDVKGEKATYVRGAVLHRGREHRPVYLAGWYRAYPNTAVSNWTVHGDVD